MREPYISRFRDEVKEKLGVPLPRMVTEFYQAQGRALFAAREAARRGIRTRRAWRAERNRLRRELVAAIGGRFRGSGTLVKECGEVRVEQLVMKRLLFSPLPDHWVSANLYLPLQGEPPYPGMVLPHGHSMGGKGGAGWAAFFVLNGYAALTFDYLGGGERSLLGPDGRPVACSSGQHNIVGARMALDGYNLQWFMLAETLGAVDVLCGREEVDARRIGITGSSGGGTESFFAAALDERICAAVPAASVHSSRRKLYPDDAEQCLFDMIRRGLEYPDVASFLIAPRPLLIVANTQDIWDIEGTRYVFKEARRLYRLLGAGDRIAIDVTEAGHSYGETQHMTALRWLNRWLGNRRRPVGWEQVAKVSLPSEEDCKVTASGNVFAEGYKTPSQVFRAHLACKGAGPRGRRAAVRRLVREVRAGTGRKVQWGVIDSFVAGEAPGQRIVFSPEDGLLLPCDILMPDRPTGVAILLDELPRMEGLEWQAEAAARGDVAFRPDLRGWGETVPEESWPDWEGWCQNLYGGKRCRLLALMQLVGRNPPPQRARDVIALLNIADQMELVGRRMIWGRRGGALVALLAGVADARVDELFLEQFLYSFADLREREVPLLWADSVVFGLLRLGLDVADLCRVFRPRKLTFRRPLDGLMRPVPVSRMRALVERRR